MALNRAVHIGLSHAWLIRFVVTTATIAIHVDHDIFLELGPEVHRNLDHLSHRFGMLTIDVEDRNLQHLRNIGVVNRAHAVGRQRGEADLVIDNNVDRTTHTITRQLAEVERFLHNTFADESSIAMDLDRHVMNTLFIRRSILLGANPSHQNGFTYSRWLGLKHSERWTILPVAVFQSLLYQGDT